MSVDFPRAWQIAKATPYGQHHPQCSYRTARGGFLCDCEVLWKHPEVTDDEFTGVDGKVIEQKANS